MLGFVIGVMVGLAARTLWDQYRTGSLVEPPSTSDDEPSGTVEDWLPPGAWDRIKPHYIVCVEGAAPIRATIDEDQDWDAGFADSADRQVGQCFLVECNRPINRPGEGHRWTHTGVSDSVVGHSPLPKSAPEPLEDDDLTFLSFRKIQDQEHGE